jgi:hypothetical protein
MVLLWTIGGLCHSIYDSTIWHLDACFCCLQRDYARINCNNANNNNVTLNPTDINFWRKAGRYIVITSTLILTAIASCSIVVFCASTAATNMRKQQETEFLLHVQDWYKEHHSTTANNNNETRLLLS